MRKFAISRRLQTLQEPAPGLRMLNSNVLATIFAGVNDNLEGLDDDSHEFSFEEFYVAMCIVAMYCNRPIDAIVFPGARNSEALIQPKKETEQLIPQAGELTKLMKPVVCNAIAFPESCLENDSARAVLCEEVCSTVTV